MKNLLALSKTFFLASLIAHSEIAIAGGKTCPEAPISCPPLPVTIRCPDYTYETSFKGLAMQPFANNLDYVAEALPFNYGDSQPAVSPSWVIPQLSPDFHFGFDLGGAFIFHDAYSSLMLNWERYHTSNDSASITVDSINNMVGTFFEIGPDASPYKTGKGKVSFHFDEVNLDYGTFVHFGNLLRMNLFAGVSFGRIVQHLSTKISNLSETIVRTIDVPAQFTGAGPQVGFDFNYKVVKGLQFVGKTRATLFVGTFKNSTTYTTKSADLVSLGDQNPNVQTMTVYNKGGVVPGLEGNLGLAYEYLFRKHYMVKIEAGYQAQIYINAIRSTDMGSEVALAAIGSVGSSTTGVYARTIRRMVSDFGLAGPYATFNLGF